MLPHYSPLKVAETFSMLGGLHGDRIDLGIGRAPGSDRETMFALQRDRRQMSPDDFPEQLAELLAYFEDDFPDDHLFARLAALPGAPGRPDVWLLGSSPQSAIWAGELGLPYSVADFINPDGAENARLYRERFAPSRRRAQPEIDRLRVGDLRRDRRGGPAARRQPAHGDHAAAPRPADRGARRSRRRSRSSPRRASARAPAAGASSSARRTPCAPGSRRSRPSTAPTRCSS